MGKAKKPPKKLPRRRADFSQMTLEAVGGRGDDNRPLDDPKLKGSWHGSVVVGDFFEELTSHLFGPLGAARFVIDATADVCPDHIQHHGEFFVECKATGPHGRHWFMFKKMVENYEEMLDTYWPIAEDLDFEPIMLFVFWLHGIRAKIGDFEYQSDLQSALSKNVRECYVLDFEMVKKILAENRLEDGSKWRGDFWRIRPHQLRGIGEDPREWVKKWSGKLNGYVPFDGAMCGLYAYSYPVEPFPVRTILSKGLYGKRSLRKFRRAVSASGWSLT